MLASVDWIDDRMAWQKITKMFRHTNRANARTTATMWNAKCFMQIQMAHIRANFTGTRQANLRVHVGAIHVDLTTMFVNNVAQFLNAILKNSVRAWIGHHAA